MKEPNVLEAVDLCMNGNPVENPGDIWMYEITCMIESCLRSLRKPWPAFEEGGVSTRDAKVRFKGALSNFHKTKAMGISNIGKPFEIDVPVKFGKSKPVDAFKAPPSKSFWNKVWDSIELLFGVRDPWEPHVSDAFHENQRRYAKAYASVFRQDYSERVKESMTFEEMISGEKVLVFINHKVFRKLMYGKKRYSISTPITKAT